MEILNNYLDVVIKLKFNDCCEGYVEGLLWFLSYLGFCFVFICYFLLYLFVFLSGLIIYNDCLYKLILI